MGLVGAQNCSVAYDGADGAEKASGSVGVQSHDYPTVKSISGKAAAIKIVFDDAILRAWRIAAPWTSSERWIISSGTDTWIPLMTPLISSFPLA